MNNNERDLRELAERLGLNADDIHNSGEEYSQLETDDFCIRSTDGIIVYSEYEPHEDDEFTTNWPLLKAEIEELKSRINKFDGK